MRPSEYLLYFFESGFAVGGFNLETLIVLIGFGVRPNVRGGTCHVCGSEVLLMIGGTDLQSSLRKCARL